MKKTPLFFVWIAMLLAPVIASAQQAPAAPELPVKKYEGAELLDTASSPYEAYKLRNAKGASRVDGKITRLFYRVKNAPALEVFRNYQQQLTDDGFGDMYLNEKDYYEMPRLFCPQAVNICGTDSTNTPIFTIYVQNIRYLSALKKSDEGDVTVAVLVGEVHTPKEMKLFNGKKMKLEKGEILVGVDIVQPKPLTRKMIQESASFITDALNKQGKVDLYGIYFDFDKADLKLESAPVLEEIGKALKSDPALKLKVVGHTDNAGGAEYNQTLSQNRAAAVVSALVSRQGIDPSRVTPEGKGASQPVESNDTETGRAKNRRVELIKQ